MFRSAAHVVTEEKALRQGLIENRLSFGIDFLDHALKGITQTDVVLAGAYSGAGKTQFCVNVALANLEQNKRVHFFALEAEYAEIERRLKFSYVANYYFSDPNRPKLDCPLSFSSWLMGEVGPNIEPYDEMAEKFCVAAFKNLFTRYKVDDFDVNALAQEFIMIENETDLVILDHVHYLDWDEESDNRAVKKIAKTVRSLALGSRKPVILVSHLRKRDRHNKEIAPGLDEFHGSSDLYKIATKVITIASGGPDPDGRFITYFRTPKNRIEGGVTRFLARTMFDPKKGTYEKGYRLGWANAADFGDIDPAFWPHWAKRSGDGAQHDSLHERNKSNTHSARPKNHAPRFNPSERD